MRCQSIAAEYLRCAIATAFVLCAGHTYVCCMLLPVHALNRLVLPLSNEHRATLFALELF